MHKLRYPSLAIVLALSLYLFPLVPRTFIDLNMVNFHVVTQPGQVPALGESRAPRGGEQVLPPQVQQMLHLLRQNSVPSYRYSSVIGQNEEIRQRLIEGAYPIRVSETANYLLSSVAEAIPPGCRIVGSEGGVLLVHCP